MYDTCELEARLAKLFHCYSQDAISKYGDRIPVDCTPDSLYYTRPGYCISHYHNSTIYGYCPATFGWDGMWNPIGGAWDSAFSLKI